MDGTRPEVARRGLLNLFLIPNLFLILWAAASPSTGDAAAADKDHGPAPAFTLESTAGERVTLATALERGPVIVDFWATWCGPCKQSLPELQRLHERHAERGLTILAISTDEPRNRPKIGSTARSLGLTFPILIDADKRAAQLYRVESIPMTFLIDREGRIRSLHRGYRRGDIELLEEQLLPLLEAPSAVPAEAPAPAAGEGSQ
ncbi:TlpA family protein disulfide reductase [bacterium]|nr:TlpA family protein disulfide reductase [bacterium]